MENGTKLVNLFVVGNVLDPHVRIEGKCRQCDGTCTVLLPTGDRDNYRFDCTECGGTGRASALVRLSELVTVMGPAAVWVGDRDEDSMGAVMRLESKTFNVQYRVFDVGERVRLEDPSRAPVGLDPRPFYTVTAFLEPQGAGDKASVQLDLPGIPRAFPSDWFEEADQE